MTTFNTAAGELLVDTEYIEVTTGGTLADPGDSYRRFAPGATYYYLNGEPITKAEAAAILSEHLGQ